MSEARIKNLTGGEPVAARFMGEDYFEFTPKFKPIIIGNHHPTLTGVDESIRRRIVILPFDRRPKKVDKKLEEKLLDAHLATRNNL